MKTVRFSFLKRNWCYGAYECLMPGDQSGTYVKAEVAEELLEALESLVAAMVEYEYGADGEPPYKHREMMRQARAAIATAKGE